MNSKADIEALANLKYNEAECLFNAGFFDGAYYMGGYVIELLLKAKVCKTLNINDFFLFSKGKAEIYKPYKSHDYDQLLLLSGIYNEFEIESKLNPDFKIHWSVVSVWNEGARYLTGKSKTETESFLISIKEVASWIRKHL